jgi:hypothetical protein
MTTDTVTLKLKVESLGAAFHVGARLQFSYRAPHTHSLVPVDGTLTEPVGRPVPSDDGPPQPVILMVDGLRHAVPAGTVVTVEAKELR